MGAEEQDDDLGGLTPFPEEQDDDLGGLTPFLTPFP
jgi:hypothetical protein